MALSELIGLQMVKSILRQKNARLGSEEAEFNRCSKDYIDVDLGFNKKAEIARPKVQRPKHESARKL